MKRFLLEEMPTFALDCQPTYVEISYLCNKPEIVMVQRGSKYYLGEIDTSEDLTFNFEGLKQIDALVYAALSTAVKSKSLVYEKYNVKLADGKNAFIYKYLGSNDGKVVIEVDDSVTSLPEYFGKELNSKKDYSKFGFILKNK